jgi:SAM-dependent methyltransferase
VGRDRGRPRDRGSPCLHPTGRTCDRRPSGVSPSVSSSAYDELASVYDRWLSGDMNAAPCLKFYIALLADEDGRVLELGTGTGRISRILAAAGVRVIGLDASAPMLALNRAADPAGALVRGEFAALPFRPGFDVVVCPMRTIGHLLSGHERACLLAEVHRVLRPGGRFVFDHYNIDLDWAAAHEGRPILMYAGPDDGDTEVAVLVWDQYDYQFTEQKLGCSVRVERVTIGGDVLDSAETAFDFTWLRHEQVVREATDAGFEIEACFGDFDRSPWSTDAEQMIWVLRLPTG